jgi:hypothetical protein
MKRLLLITSLIAFVAFAQAQTIHTFSPGGQNYFSYAGVAGDTISGVSGSVSKILDLRRATGLVQYSLQVKVDSVSNVAGHTITLAGSVDNSNYHTISTVTWAGTTADTTFLWTNTQSTTIAVSIGDSTSTVTQTDLVLYPYLRVRLAGDGAGKSKINRITGKLVQK